MDLFSLQESKALITGALAIALAFYFYTLKRKPGKYRAVPEPSGAWPIVGHINIFSGSSDLPYKVLAALAVKYGPIFTVRLGIRKVLVVHDWQIAKEIFTTHDAIISNRPKFLASEILGYNHKMFGMGPHSPFWVEMRKIISLELLSNRRLEQLKHVRISELEISLKHTYELWREKRDKNGKVLVEMKKWFGEFNMNAVLRTVIGKRFNGATNPEEEKEMNRCREVMRDFFHLFGTFTVADALPFLRWLDLGGHEKNMKRVAKEIDNMGEKWLDEHRKNRKSLQSGEEKDFMDMLISAVESGSLSEYDADTTIKSTCMILITSSTDTTTVMLTWTLCLLLNNPHALKIAQEELDNIVGRDRQVNESDINNLVYLQAIIKETLRLYPAGRLGGLREFSEDCTIAGYHVPKGTWLTTNLFKLQQDSEIWSNPSEFRPERFLDGNHKHVDVKGTHFELIPFGAGRRSCTGIGLALQILHLVIATFLQHFDISTPGDAPVDMTETAGMTNAMASPLEVLISPRMSSTIY
ncbi:cytochrome P450 [Artemisia annua]|uniref:Cytochrome P450 n=1 Tax=Artemisia annua TaxID=35608 RepID=A0A2U1M9Q7_ARTAN|nr:cytochrome P450 [Artemisia annua]